MIKAKCFSYIFLITLGLLAFITVFQNGCECTLLIATAILRALGFLWNNPSTELPSTRTTMIPLYPVLKCHPCPSHCRPVVIQRGCPLCSCPGSQEEACRWKQCNPSEVCVVSDPELCRRGICTAVCQSNPYVSLFQCQTACLSTCAKIEIDTMCSACLCLGLLSYPDWYRHWFLYIMQNKLMIISETGVPDSEIKPWFLLFMAFMNLHKVNVGSPEDLTTLFTRFIQFLKSRPVEYNNIEIIIQVFREFLMSLTSTTTITPLTSTITTTVLPLNEQTRFFISKWFKDNENKISVKLGTIVFTKDDLNTWLQSFLKFLAKKTAVIQNNDSLLKWVTSFADELKIDTEETPSERGLLLDISLNIKSLLETKTEVEDEFQCKSACPLYCNPIKITLDCAACLCIGKTALPDWYANAYLTLLGEKSYIFLSTGLNNEDELQTMFRYFVGFLNSQKMEIKSEKNLKDIFVNFIKYVKENAPNLLNMEIIKQMFKDFAKTVQPQEEEEVEKTTKIEVTTWLQNLMSKFQSDPSVIYNTNDYYEWLSHFLKYIGSQNVLIRDKDDINKWLTNYMDYLKTSQKEPQSLRSQLLQTTANLKNYQKKAQSNHYCHDQCPVGCIKLVIDSTCSVCLCVHQNVPQWLVYFIDILKAKFHAGEFPNIITEDELKKWFILFVNFLNLKKIKEDSEDAQVQVFKDFVHFMKDNNLRSLKGNQLQKLLLEFGVLLEQRHFLNDFVSELQPQILQHLQEEGIENVSRQDLNNWFVSFKRFISDNQLPAFTQEQILMHLRTFMDNDLTIRNSHVTEQIKQLNIKVAPKDFDETTTPSSSANSATYVYPNGTRVTFTYYNSTHSILHVFKPDGTKNTAEEYRLSIPLANPFQENAFQTELPLINPFET